jgi:hypothetical protein
MKKSIVSFPLLSLLAAGLLSGVFAADQEASMSGFQFLDFLPSPRQVGMGYAGTALGGAGFGVYNPASPALDAQPYLNLGYAPLPSENTLAFCEGAWTFLNMFAAVNFTNEFIGGIIPSDFINGPDYNVPGSYDGSALSLCFGYKGENLGLAICLNGMQERIVSSTSYGISVSAGLTYRLIPDRLTLGAAVFQLGSTTGGLDETRAFGEGAPLPRSGRAGAAYSDTLLGIGYTVTGDVVYRDVGYKVTSLSQLGNRVSVPVGVEAWLTRYIALRIGKRFNYDTDVLSVGAGLRFAMLSFDMACAVTSLVSDIEFNPYFALTYTLVPPKQASVKKTSAAARQPATAKPLEMQPAEVKPAEVNPPEAKPAEAKGAAASRPDTVAPASQTIIGTPAPAAVRDSLAAAPARPKADSVSTQTITAPKPPQAPADSASVKQQPSPPGR